VLIQHTTFALSSLRRTGLLYFFHKAFRIKQTKTAVIIIMIKKNPYIWCVKYLVAVVFTSLNVSINAAESLDFAVTVTSPPNSPQAQTNAALDTVCNNLTTDNSGSNLSQVCSFLSNATLEQSTLIAKELSAKTNTASKTLVSRTPSMGSSQHGVGARLSALRNSVKKSVLNSFLPNAKSKLNAFGENDGGLLSQRLSAYINAHSVTAEQFETQTEIGYDSTSNGLMAGADYRLLNRTFIGLVAQYYQTSADLTDVGSAMNANQMGITVYSTHFLSDRWYFEGTLNNSQQQIDLKRQINLNLNTTVLNTVAKGNTDSQQFGVYLGTGYDIPLMFGFNSVISAGISYTSTTIDAYSENGAGNLGLDIDSQSIPSLTSLVNVYLSKVFSTSLGIVIPQISASWIHETESKEQLIAAKFVNNDQTKFLFSTPTPDPNYFVIGADLQLLLTHGRMFFLKYTNVRRLRDKEESSIIGGFRMEF